MSRSGSNAGTEPEALPKLTNRPRLARLGRWARAGGLAVTLLYGGVVLIACVFQRGFMYFPDPAEQAPPKGGPIQVVRLRAPDGEPLIAWWMPPAAGRPTLLFFGGNGDTLSAQGIRFAACAAEGVGLLAVAYEGYSGSGGHPSEAALTGDANAAYAWLAARVPTRDVVIEGFSLGTGVAVRLAATHAARALVLEAPYTSAFEVGAEKAPFLPVGLLMWDRFESRRWIRQVHMPVLIVHGTADSVIPFHFGRELFALANEPKTFVAVPGVEHVQLIERGLYPRIWSFLGLPPAPAAQSSAL